MWHESNNFICINQITFFFVIGNTFDLAKVKHVNKTIQFHYPSHNVATKKKVANVVDPQDEIILFPVQDTVLLREDSHFEASES